MALQESRATLPSLSSKHNGLHLLSLCCAKKLKQRKQTQDGKKGGGGLAKKSAVLKEGEKSRNKEEKVRADSGGEEGE